MVSKLHDYPDLLSGCDTAVVHNCHFETQECVSQGCRAIDRQSQDLNLGLLGPRIYALSAVPGTLSGLTLECSNFSE